MDNSEQLRNHVITEQACCNYASIFYMNGHIYEENNKAINYDASLYDRHILKVFSRSKSRPTFQFRVEPADGPS